MALIYFKLIGGLEDWCAIAESVKGSSDYRVLRDGVLFTVVQQFGNLEHTLIFWNQHQVFGSEFSFVEAMTPVRFERAGTSPSWHAPAFFFMKPHGAQGVAGYAFGIEVRDWWWEG
ncbi:MAG TPA: hypothetical protein VIY49_08790 [Bryobacteraceae bacterium]